MNASVAYFEPEPPTPRIRPTETADLLLPYTHIWTELLKLGISWGEAIRMPWSVCRMLFEARADAYDAAKNGRNKEEIRYATKEDYDNWI